jgi:hypothetical protein
MQIGHLIAIGLDQRPDALCHVVVGSHVEPDCFPYREPGPYDQAAITTAPNQARDRSIHCQPSGPPRERPTMTITDTAASAITWIMAARMLLSRCAARSACSCSAKFDDMDIAAVMRLTRTVKACGSFSWVGPLGSLPLATCAVQ